MVRTDFFVTACDCEDQQEESNDHPGNNGRGGLAGPGGVVGRRRPDGRDGLLRGVVGIADEEGPIGATARVAEERCIATYANRVHPVEEQTAIPAR